MSGLGDFFYLQQSFGKTRNSPSHAAFAFSYSLRLLILGSFYCCLKKKTTLNCKYKTVMEKVMQGCKQYDTQVICRCMHGGS